MKNLTVDDYRRLFTRDALEQLIHMGEREVYDPEVRREVVKIKEALKEPE